MTPRALVTAIATTAFGFVLIISSVAGSTSTAGGQASEAFGKMTRYVIHIQPAEKDDTSFTSPHLERTSYHIPSIA